MTWTSCCCNVCVHICPSDFCEVDFACCHSAGPELLATAAPHKHVPSIPLSLPPLAQPDASLRLAMQQQSPLEYTVTDQGSLTILLSRVALGNSTRGSSELRRPPEGYDSTNHHHLAGRGRSLESRTHISCVYDNAQAYPDYIITYKAMPPCNA